MSDYLWGDSPMLVSINCNASRRVALDLFDVMTMNQEGWPRVPTWL